MISISENAYVLLIGASRGLGYAIAAEYIDRGSCITATVRGPDRTALHELQDSAGSRLEIEHLDIDSPEQSPVCQRWRHQRPGGDHRRHCDRGVHPTYGHQRA
jgi:NAD(P)-dependent dehydrogenase (short-subunit alcohol dehydrogenase family)